MTMGSKQDEQPELFVTYQDMPRSMGHVFYEALEKVLRSNGFDRFAERECEASYSPYGRPSLAPGVYFRCLLVGYFEGVASERGIAWRVQDSLSLREFVGVGLTNSPPDHSTISRTRRLLDLETHNRIFDWVLVLLARVGLVKGRTVGVDGTTMEANAALRSLVRREDGQTYKDFLVALAKAEGIENPTREDIARLDRKRSKKGSNDEWYNPHDPDAKVAKMKSGATDMAHKVEHAVDMDTGAVLAVQIFGGSEGDTKTLGPTLEAASANLEQVRNDLKEARKDDDDDDDGAPDSGVAERIEEVVADKGYHSNDVLCELEEAEIRSYIAEPKRGRRKWSGKEAEQKATYANRRRKKGQHGRELMRKRGELIERSFAHAYGTGNMRRTYLRGHENILKRLLIHSAGLNLGILMRQCFGVGTPRGLQGALAAFLHALFSLVVGLVRLLRVFDCHETHDSGRRPSIGSGWCAGLC